MVLIVIRPIIISVLSMNVQDMPIRHEKHTGSAANLSRQKHGWNSSHKIFFSSDRACFLKESIIAEALQTHRKYAILLYKFDCAAAGGMTERFKKGRMIEWKYMNLLRII